jgi:peptidoglycan hydrolase-like protein with peptidoglycan-binding domain/uncharacterized protein YecT (DUF1311 family)
MRAEALAVALLSAFTFTAALAEQRVGPSFDCTAALVAQQPLPQIICSDDDLASADLSYVNAYQAVRHGADDQERRMLTAEANAVVEIVTSDCKIPKAGKLGGPASSLLIDCVREHFSAQRAIMMRRLRGDALEEAQMTPRDAVQVQQTLKDRGWLGETAVVDGVLGPATRTALADFQRSAGLQATGFASRAVLAALLAPPRNVPSDDPVDREAGKAATIAGQAAFDTALDLGQPMKQAWEHVARAAGRAAAKVELEAGRTESQSGAAREQAEQQVRQRATAADASGQDTQVARAPVPLVPPDPSSLAPETRGPRVPVSPTVSNSSTSLAISKQQRLIDAVEKARQQFQAGTNDLARGSARPMRAREVCSHLSGYKADDWGGTVSRLDTNGDGKGVLMIDIGNDVKVGTWNNALSDIADDTLIEPNSPVFMTAMNFKVGQKVRFSGTFIPADVDCIKERSLTLSGSIRSPEYIIRFQSIKPD